MDIYAEISKKYLREIEEGKRDLLMPDGVRLIRKHNSRACFFSCDDDVASEQLKDMLDNVGVSWQED